MPTFQQHPDEGRAYLWFRRYVLDQVQQLRDDANLPEHRRGEVRITSPAREGPILRVEGGHAGFSWLHDLLYEQQPELNRLADENFALRQRLAALEDAPD